MMHVKRAAGSADHATFAAGLASSSASALDDGLQSLREDLSYATEVEHATIPPYLTALFSLLDGTNNEIRGIIRSVVVQEMLHMALAGNMLSAIGGKPVFTDPKFLPSYPGDLPFEIAGVEVHLKPFSKALVNDVFLKIEEPEHGAIPFKSAAAFEAGPTYQTIGEFYGVVRKKFEDLSRIQNIFVPNAKQVLHPDGAFRIESLSDALRAIDLIVQQGEGTATLPLEGRGSQLAHYYRFNEIVKGAALVADPMADLKFSYTGYPIPFDEAGVIPILTDAKLAMYPPDSKAYRLARQFNGLYGSMLRTLEEAYGPNAIEDANIVGLMFDMKIVAQRLTSTAIPGTPNFATPTFEYAGPG